MSEPAAWIQEMSVSKGRALSCGRCGDDGCDHRGRQLMPLGSPRSVFGVVIAAVRAWAGGREGMRS